MKRILFVCTGNTCRSPMAAALFNRLAALEPPGFEFVGVSAGLAVSAAAPASMNAVLALKDYPGCDLSAHVSRNMSCADADEAFLVLTMEPWHRRELLLRCPGANQKVFTLKEYVYGVSGGISDPYGGSLAEYKSCAREIAEYVDKLVKILRNRITKARE